MCYQVEWESHVPCPLFVSMVEQLERDAMTYLVDPHADPTDANLLRERLRDQLDNHPLLKQPLQSYMPDHTKTDVTALVQTVATEIDQLCQTHDRDARSLCQEGRILGRTLLELSNSMPIRVLLLEKGNRVTTCLKNIWTRVQEGLRDPPLMTQRYFVLFTQVSQQLWLNWELAVVHVALQLPSVPATSLSVTLRQILRFFSYALSFATRRYQE